MTAMPHATHKQFTISNAAEISKWRRAVRAILLDIYDLNQIILAMPHIIAHLMLCGSCLPFITAKAKRVLVPITR